MKRFAFIHGSSVGQSTFVPTDAVEDICKILADRYFKGRISRQKSSATNEALFVDLCKDQSGTPFVVYSYVNNFCRGKSDETDKLGRDGQYFALSVVYDSVYLFPEEVYRILRAAYEQMFQRGSILGYNTKGEVQYRISQFSEEGEYLSAFLEKVITNLDKFVGTGKSLKADSRFADYDSWAGYKVSLDVCNSLTSYNQLCEVGRLYISDTYESPSEKNQVLEKEVQSLKKERADLEERIAKMMKSAGSKARDEIAKLQKVINEQEVEIKSSKSQLEEYEATINIVHRQLDKYAKLGKKISNVQEQTPQYEKKDKKDMLKICLLFIIMFLTIVNGVLSYCFFRDLSPSPEEETKGEIAQNVTPAKTQHRSNQAPQTSAAIGSETEKSSSYLTVVPNSIASDAQGKVEKIQVETDGVWDAPVVPKADCAWLSLDKISEKELLITVKDNNTSDERRSIFMIESGSFQQQITVTQKGKVISAQICPDYGVVIKDEAGQVLSKGDIVFAGQTLTATVTNPNLSATGYGWTCSNCTTPDRHKNNKDIRVTVNKGLKDGTTVAIGYGKLPESGNNNANLREKVQFKFKAEQNNTDSENSQPPSSTSQSIKEENRDSTGISSPSAPNA